ncbi:MAG: hypothetical protein HQ507_00855 [Candidatus Marinimicrobia bacterium]|nr:hypothetical protein [Candidatus Neomarinimicrobiota bacterium]
MSFPPKRFLALISLSLVLVFNSCYLSDLHIREKLRPIRRMFNKSRTYWTDKIEYKGASGNEIVFYKNGRPALERSFDERGLLKSVIYLGLNGAPLRSDSLVYAGEELIGGYYFSEPFHRLVLHFLSYKQQGQLSQRSWFGGAGELLSREFFLFDRKGNRRMRLIFDSNDSLLYSETFKADSDKLDFQNTYSLNGNLVRQVRYEENRGPYSYEINSSQAIQRISHLLDDGTPAWSIDLVYDQAGAVERSNFSIKNRFLFAYLGDLELFRQSVRSWQHPAQPQRIDQINRFSHRDPFVSQTVSDSLGFQYLEYRLPKSGAVFKRSILDSLSRPLSDTIYASLGGVPIPASVVTYDSRGGLAKEVTYDVSAKPKWLHTWFRDDDRRVIREELTALPDTFASAITRFYDTFNLPAFSERFAAPDSFDGTWVFYRGGGINQKLFYDSQSELTESWLLRPAGDTARHSRFKSIDYFRIESKYGPNEHLDSQVRFTDDGLLNWEIFFDEKGRLTHEINRKKDGSIYKEVSYDHETLGILSSTYAPTDSADRKPGMSLRGELTSRITQRLNSQGETIQILSANSSGETAWEKRNAYRDGRLLKSAQLDSQGKPVYISSYRYNEIGQVVEETAVDKDGNLVHSVELRYDEDNHLIWKSFTSSLAKTASANRYYYDEFSRVNRDEIIEAQRFIEAVEYDYYPKYFMRLATHYTPDGTILRKELENYFGKNVFTVNGVDPE